MKIAVELLISTFIIVITKEGNVTAECATPGNTCSHCITKPSSNTGTTHPVGNYLELSCEENYVMDGPSDVILWVCGQDGQWSGEQPNCTAMTCPDPPIPAYGGVNPVTDDLQPGGTITYSCLEGYQLNGSADNTCSMDGSWENLPPTCQISEESCDTSELDIMTSPHSCIKAAKLLDTTTMTWNKAKINCQDLGSGTIPSQLALIKTQTMQDDIRILLNYPKTLGFEVDSYFWIGASEGRNWKWNSDNSDIQRLFWADGQPTSDSGSDCIALSSSDEYLWKEASCGSNNRFICQYDGSCTGRSSDGGVLLLDHRHKCFRFSNTDATWSDAIDVCTSEGGSLIEFMDESMQSFLTQQTSQLELADWWIGGYADVTETERAWFWVDNTRANFMSWNRNQPDNKSKKCVEVNSKMNHNWNDKRCNAKRQAMCQIGIGACGDPGAPTHGTRSPGDRSTFLDGAVIQFYCDPGYLMEGASEITCLPNGSWDDIKPTCTVLSCDDPAPRVDNAVVTVKNPSYRGIAIYTCNDGSFPSGNPFSYCQPNGSWSQPIFTCNEDTTAQISTSFATTTTTQLEFTKSRPSTSSTTTITTQPAPETSKVRLTHTSQIATSQSAPSSSSGFTLISSSVQSTASSTAYPTKATTEETRTEQGNVTRTVDAITIETKDGIGRQNISGPPALKRRTSHIMYPIGASLAVLIVVIITVLCIVVLRRRHLQRLADITTIGSKTHDAVCNDYDIPFHKNAQAQVGNNNDVYIGLDIGSMERLDRDTDESWYMSLGQGIHGHTGTGTESRGRSNTHSSTTQLVAVDDEGYASLRMSEVRGNHQLAYTTLSHSNNSHQRRVDNVSQAAREGVELDQFRADFGAIHRASIDRSSNIYETLDTPRPSVDMGVIRKQGSLDSNDYEEVDDLNVSCTNGVGPKSSQNSTTVSKSEMIASNPSPSRPTPLRQLNKHETTSLDEKRTTTYDKVDDATLMFNDLYTPSNDIKGEMPSHQTGKNIKTGEKSAINSTNSERTYDKVHDEESDMHKIRDARNQVSGRGGHSDAPKTNLQHETQQDEASYEPTINRPTSYDPYYFSLNPSKDTTDEDMNELSALGDHSVGMDKENKKDQSRRESEDAESNTYHTLEPPAKH